MPVCSVQLCEGATGEGVFGRVHGRRRRGVSELKPPTATDVSVAHSGWTVQLWPSTSSTYCPSGHTATSESAAPGCYCCSRKHKPGGWAANRFSAGGQCPAACYAQVLHCWADMLGPNVHCSALLWWAGRGRIVARWFTLELFPNTEHARRWDLDQ